MRASECCNIVCICFFLALHTNKNADLIAFSLHSMCNLGASIVPAFLVSIFVKLPWRR